MLVEYPYVIVNNGEPCYIYYSKEPMYATGKEGHIVYNATCTMKQVNKNAPTTIAEKPLVGDYYHSGKLWMIALANYDVKKWTGTIPS